MIRRFLQRVAKCNHITRHGYRICVRLAVASSIVLAVLVLAVYVLLGRFDAYKHELVVLVQDQLGADLSVDLVRVSWQGWQPVIVFRDVAVHKEGFSAELDMLRLKPDIVRSIVGLGLVLDYAHLDGVRLFLADDWVKGDWRQSTEGLPIDKVDFYSLLQEIFSVVVVRTYVHLDGLGIFVGEPQQKSLFAEVISGARATLFAATDSYQLQLEVGKPGFAGVNQVTESQPGYLPTEYVRAVARIYKDSPDEGNRDKRIAAYLKVRAFDLTALLHAFLPEDSRWQHLRNIKGNTELWYEDIAGQHQVYTRLAIEDWAFDLPDSSLQLADVDAELSWQANQDLSQHKFWLRHVTFREPGLNKPSLNKPSLNKHSPKQEALLWKADDMYLTLTQENQLTQMAFSAESVVLDEVFMNLAPFAVFPSSVSDFLVRLRPVGRLSQLRGHGKLEDDFLLEFSALVKGFSMQRVAGIPSIADFDAMLTLGYQKGIVDGTVHWDDDAFSLHLPVFYSQPWLLEQSRGLLNWQMDIDGRLSFIGHSMLAYINQTPVELDLGIHTDLITQDTELQILARTKALAAERYPEFIPDKRLPALLQWLKEAAPKGRVRDAVFVYNNTSLKESIPDIQFGSVNQTMLVAVDLVDAELRFSPQWPRVTGNQVSLLVDLDKLAVNATDGRMGGIGLGHTFVEYDYGKQEFYVDAQYHASQQEVISFLQDLPLTQRVQSLQTLSDVKGHIGGRIAFNLTLNPVDHLVNENIGFDLVLLDLNLHETGFRQRDYNVSVENLAGRLVYDKARDIKASGELLGKLNQEKLRIVASDSRQNKVFKTLWTSVLPKALLNSLDDGLTDYVTFAGESQIHVKFDWNRGFKLTLTSDLKGIALHLTEPLAKKQTERRWLVGELNLGKLFNLSEPGFTGKLHLWMDSVTSSFVEPLLSLYLKPHGVEPLASLDLIMPKLRLGNLLLRDIKSELKKAGDTYNITLDADRVKGRAEINPELYRVQIDKLDLPALHQADKREENNAQKSHPLIKTLRKLQPSSVPELVLDIKALTYDARLITDLTAHFQPEQDGLRLTQFSAAHDGVMIDGEFFWSDQQNNSLDLHLQGQNIEGLFESITAEELNFSTQLKWQGLPIEPDLHTLQGKMQVHMNKGNTISSDTGMNFLSVFGLLNINTLFRRLSLDFSDLTNTGLAFDRLKGEAYIKNGILKIKDKFSIKSPSVDIEFAGSTDLVNRTFDQKVAVILPLTESLPLTSILIGTPQVAGVVWLTSLLFSGLFSHFSGATYTITGSFDNPELELDKLFDTNVLSDSKKRPEIDWEPK